MRKKVLPLAVAATLAGSTGAAAQPAAEGYGDVPGVNRTVAATPSQAGGGDELAATGLDAGFYGILGAVLLAGGVLLHRTARPDRGR